MRAAASVLVLAILALIPLVLHSEYVVNLFILFFLYVIVAQSWNLLGGFAGQVSLGHSAFFGTGALVTRLLWVSHVPIVFALAAGGLGAMMLAALVGSPCLRMRSAYFPIGTLALAMIAQITVANIFPLPGSLSSEYLKGYTIFPRYYLALLVATLAVVVVFRFARSCAGLALVAIRDDEGAAEAMGVRTTRYKILALMVSSLFAGLGGGIFAFHQISYYYYAPFELSWSFLPTLTTFIGGLGTVGGPVLGAACFLGLSEVFALSLGEIHMVVFAFTFILVVLFVPGGLMSVNDRFRTLPAGLARRLGSLRRKAGG